MLRRERGNGGREVPKTQAEDAGGRHMPQVRRTHSQMQQTHGPFTAAQPLHPYRFPSVIYVAAHNASYLRI